MKLRSVLILILALPLFSFAQQTDLFSYKRTSGLDQKRVKYIKYYVQGEKIRIEFALKPEEGADIVRIVDASSNRVKVLFPQQKIAIVGKLSEMNSSALDSAKVEVVGKCEPIAGSVCTETKQVFKTAVISACIDESVDFDYNKMVAQVLGAFEVVLPKGMKGMPLAWSIEDDGQKVVVKLIERTKIETPANLFSIPEGYKKIER